jgi:hypothetical protein
MKIFHGVILTGFIVGFTAFAAADQRYQAVSISSGADFGTEKALILDTVAGHMWIWTESPATEDEPGGRYIIYQGLLVPGAEIGDVVLKQEWPTPILAPPNGKP